MTYKNIVEAILERAALSSLEKLVLIVLATHADKTTREAQLPGRDLERLTGFSGSSVRRALRRLEELGIVSRTRCTEPDGGNAPSRYRLELGDAPPPERPQLRLVKSD